MPRMAHFKVEKRMKSTQQCVNYYQYKLYTESAKENKSLGRLYAFVKLYFAVEVERR